MNKIYYELMQKAQKQRLDLDKKALQELKEIYSRNAKDLIRKAENCTGFNKAWIEDYKKYMKYKMENIDREIENLSSKKIKEAAKISAGIEGDFFNYMNGKFNLGLSDELVAGLYNVPDKVILGIINGGFYKDNKSLSERIWNYSNKNIEDVQRIFIDGLAQKTPYKDLVKQLRAYVDPKVQTYSKVASINKTYGRVEYNAMRMLRTSMNHAFLNANIEKWSKNPFIKKVKWCLSSAHSDRMHGRTDICDDINGKEFNVKDVPTPHPNCLCYQIPVTDDLNKVADDLKSWVNGKPNKALDKMFNIPAEEKKATNKPVKYKEYNKSSFSKAKKYSQEYSKLLTKEEKEAIYTYTGDGYKVYNKMLRMKNSSLYEMRMEKHKDYFDTLSSAIHKYEVKDNFITYRGSSPAFLKQNESLYNAYTGAKTTEDKVKALQSLLGDTYTEPGYMSTTIDRNITETFMKEADSLLLKIKVPKGSNQGAYIVDASKYSPEKEFLFDKETSLIFTGISEENGKIILECDLL